MIQLLVQSRQCRGYTITQADPASGEMQHNSCVKITAAAAAQVVNLWLNQNALVGAQKECTFAPQTRKPVEWLDPTVATTRLIPQWPYCRPFDL